MSEVQEATKYDTELQSVGRALQSGNWKDKSVSAYFAVRHEITSVSGVLLRGHRLIIPISHNSSPGTQGTFGNCQDQTKFENQGMVA